MGKWYCFSCKDLMLSAGQLFNCVPAVNSLTMVHPVSGTYVTIAPMTYGGYKAESTKVTFE
jgi:hypothetical protein